MKKVITKQENGCLKSKYPENNYDLWFSEDLKEKSEIRKEIIDKLNAGEITETEANKLLQENDFKPGEFLENTFITVKDQDEREKILRKKEFKKGLKLGLGYGITGILTLLTVWKLLKK